MIYIILYHSISMNCFSYDFLSVPRGFKIWLRFSLDTESGFKDVVFVTSAYGLGETVVGGTVNPDEWRLGRLVVDGTSKNHGGLMDFPIQ